MVIKGCLFVWVQQQLEKKTSCVGVCVHRDQHITPAHRVVGSLLRERRGLSMHYASSMCICTSCISGMLVSFIGAWILLREGLTPTCTTQTAVPASRVREMAA